MAESHLRSSSQFQLCQVLCDDTVSIQQQQRLMGIVVLRPICYVKLMSKT